MDVITTVVGQDKEYWNKSDRKVNEASPAYYFLKKSPLVFILGSICWLISWYFLLLHLPIPFKLFFTLLFLAGHSWGSSSWIMNMMHQKKIFTIGNQASIMRGWSMLVLYLCVIAGIATYCFQLYFSYH